MLKVCIVGMNPSTTKDDGIKPRKNHTRERLFNWIEELNISPCSFFNIVSTPGEIKRKDVQVDWIKDCLTGYDVILALGGFVSGVLKSIDVDHFKLPHPSPRNRLLNNKTYEAEVLQNCKAYIHG